MFRYLLLFLGVVMLQSVPVVYAGSANTTTVTPAGDTAGTTAGAPAGAPTMEQDVSKLLQGNTPQILQLKNGLGVYILRDSRFPLVSTRLYVRAGSAYETPQEAGISHVLEHMVFKGTDHRPAGAIAKAVESVGGYLNAATSFDYTVYLTDMPAAHWALGMDVVKDMAFNATLDAAELASEKEVVLSELQRGKDNTAFRIFEALQANSLKGTPYSRPIIGFADTIKSFTPEMMRAYIAKYYQPRNMLLVVVGDIEPAAVIAEAESLFGSLQNTSNLTPVQPINAQKMGGAPAVTVEQGPWNKVYLGMALPVPGDQDARSLPLDVLAYLLGGDGTSYLYQKYKYEKRLVDSIYVENYTFERIGMLYFSIQMDTDKVQPFWQEFIADLAALKASQFSEADIARAKLQMEDGIHRAKETLSGLASWKGRLQLFLGGEQGAENILTELGNVNSAQLQQAIDTWLVPQRVSVAVLTPKDAVLPDLRATLGQTWPGTAAAQKDAQATATGATETIDLGHGRTVVLIPDSTMPYTSVDLYMTGGDSLLPPDKQGLATLTANVLTSGAGGRSAPEIERYLADRAASIGAVAGRQTFGLSMREPTRFDTDLFALFKDMLTNPSFDATEVAREKNDQIAQIKARQDTPMGLAFMEIPPFLFPGGHAYGYRSLGTIDDVKKYTEADIREFWHQQIAQPWVMAVAGDFNKKAVLEFARSLPVPQDKSKGLGEPGFGSEKKLALHMPGREQAHLMLLFKTVPVEHKDTPGLEVLENILAGQSGLLFGELRDKQGLGYTVTAFNRSAQKTGYMIFYIGTEPDKMDKARAGFEKVINELKAKPLPEELLRGAKNQLRGDYYRERQSLASRSAEAAMLKVLGQDIQARKQRIEQAEKVTPEQLQQLAQKYLNPADAYVVTVTP